MRLLALEKGPAIEAPAATRNPADRISELNRQGLVEALNYPTLASLIEHATADGPELTLAIIRGAMSRPRACRSCCTPAIRRSSTTSPRGKPPHTQNFMAQSAFRWMALGHREIADMITSLICHGTLTRFPKLRIASVENGSSWIYPLFHDFEDLYKKMPQNFPEHPRDVFRRNIWLSPFWEGCVSDVVNTVGWDKVLFGSDYPHPEGLAEPKGFWKYAEGMDERRTYDFMGDNARRFMGLPIANPDPSAVNPPALANA